MLHMLKVGADSGWTTKLLALLVGPIGEVRGGDLESKLARSRRAIPAS